MKLVLKLAIVGLVLIAGAAMSWSFLNKRPTSLSVDIHPHPSALMAMRAIVNGAPVVDSSFRGRSQTGGLAYQSAFGANLSVQVMWFDLEQEQYFFKSFDLDTRELSTFGEDAVHAMVQIEAGPGADLTVTTPHPEGLRLVGLNRMDDITPEMDVPVLLLELCADPREDDPSEDGILMRTMADDISLTRTREQRENWLSQNEAPPSRCAGGGAN